MNIGSPSATQIADEPTKHAMLDTRAAVMTAYHTEHTFDDHHGDIHCTTISERDRTTPMGVWINVPPQPPASFTASGTMTFAVPVANQSVSYTLDGNRMMLNIALTAITVGGGASFTLAMKIPDGFTAVSFKRTAGLVSDNTYGAGTTTLLIVQSPANTQFIQFIRSDVTVFALSAGNSAIYAQIALEVR